jgi:hypothetical protein
VKYVLLYDAAADMERARVVFPAHRAKWQPFVARGDLLMVGPFSDPRQGAMGVFATREAAEHRARGPGRSGGRGEAVGAARVARGDCFVRGLGLAFRPHTAAQVARTSPRSPRA